MRAALAVLMLCTQTGVQDAKTSTTFTWVWDAAMNETEPAANKMILPNTQKKNSSVAPVEVVHIERCLISSSGRLLVALNSTKSQPAYKAFVTGAKPCFGLKLGKPTELTSNEKRGLQYMQAQNNNKTDLPSYNKVISFGGYWQYGIWHFLFEALNALPPSATNNSAAAYKRPIPTDIAVHIENNNAWATAWLGMVGVSEKQGNTIITGQVAAKHAYFPHMGACGGVNPHHAQKLAAIVKQRLDRLYGAPAQPCSTILLLRRTHSRSFSKEGMQELHQHLEELAVSARLTLTVYDDGYLSHNLLHQLHHWRQACVVVAPHGAGLTMTLAMQQGCCVIELHPKNRAKQYMYGDLAKNLHLQYVDGGEYIIDGKVIGDKRGAFAPFDKKFKQCTSAQQNAQINP